MVATADIGTIVPGAYHRPDGALCLPVHHWESGELMGCQTRLVDGGRRYSSGINMKQAAPLTPDRTALRLKPSLICEGPTDAIAVVEHGALEDCLIAGCWSSSTIPPVDWFKRLGPVVIAAGDGDPAGKAFNRRLADAIGVVYELRIPDGMDVRAILEASGKDRLESMISRSLMHDPLRRRERHVERTIAPMQGVDICSLVESAGGRRNFKLASGQLKYYCPLHDDRRDASLTVDPATGSWKCWAGCGSGGPAQFVMKWRGCDWKTAMGWLEGNF